MRENEVRSSEIESGEMNWWSGENEERNEIVTRKEVDSCVRGL